MSVPALTFPARYCENCGAPLIRKRRPAGRLEHPTDYIARRYCSDDCRATVRGIPSRTPTVPSAVSVSFTAAYRHALAQGFDLLEERDAVYECERHGRLHCESCEVLG